MRIELELIRSAQDGIEKIAQLLGGELIPFKIGDYPFVPIENNRMEGVGDEALILPKVHAECMTDFLDVAYRAS